MCLAEKQVRFDMGCRYNLIRVQIGLKGEQLNIVSAQLIWQDYVYIPGQPIIFSAVNVNMIVRHALHASKHNWKLSVRVSNRAMIIG